MRAVLENLVRASLALAAGSSASDFAQGAMPDGQGEGLLERDGITGRWWGLRDRLEGVGLTIGGEYVAEFSGVFDGGVNRAGSFRDLLTLDAEIDLETAFGVEGGAAFIQYLSVNPESGGSIDAGDIQVFSNIENDLHLDVIFELWYEQSLLDDRLRIKVGKVDANSEFAFVDTAGEFSNSSAGFSPTLFAFPSYPDPAMSVNIFGTLVQDDRHELTLGYGLYDGALVDGVPTGRQGPASFFSDDRSNEYFHIWQADLAWDDLGFGDRWFEDGRLSAGLWLHTGRFERFDGGSDDRAIGFYITAEQRLIATNQDSGGVFLFVQAGWADGDVSAFESHYAGGIVLRGITDSRPDDSAGAYISLAELSDEPAAAFDDDELVLDAYYRIQVTPAVFVQPELQLISNPSGDADIRNAVAGGIRIGIAF